MGVLCLDFSLQSFTHNAYLIKGSCYGIRLYTQSGTNGYYLNGGVFNGNRYPYFYGGYAQVGVRRMLRVGSPFFGVDDLAFPTFTAYANQITLGDEGVSMLLYRLTHFGLDGEPTLDCIPCVYDNDGSRGVYDVIDGVYYPLRVFNRLVRLNDFYGDVYGFEYKVASNIVLSLSDETTISISKGTNGQFDTDGYSVIKATPFLDNFYIYCDRFGDVLK